MTRPPPPDIPFRDRDHNGIKTVQSLQYALLQAGLDPYVHIIWDEERRFAATFGVYVVTLLDDGRYRLDIRDRGDVNPRGTYDTETDVVRAYLAQSNPRRPQDRARVRAAMQRDYVEKAEWRESLKEKGRQMTERALRERAAAGLRLDPTAEDDHPRSRDR